MSERRREAVILAGLLWCAPTLGAPTMALAQDSSDSGMDDVAAPSEAGDGGTGAIDGTAAIERALAAR